MKTRYGTTCHARGRQIDVVSDHPEWTAWAVAALEAAADAEIEQAERDAYATDREEQMRGEHPVKVILNDGGRAASGRKGSTGDCVARSIAIASGLPYQKVYDDLAYINARMPKSKRRRVRGKHLGEVTASHGIYVQSKLFKDYMKNLGFVWTPTMGIGTGCTVHLSRSQLPTGRLVVSLSRHYTAVIDGVVHDIHDPSRGGTRCVYGYWSLPVARWKMAYDCKE